MFEKYLKGSTSPFNIDTPVIPPIFSGRDTEIDLIGKGLIGEKQSIILTGNDAIGKSSLLETLSMYLLQEKEVRILPVNINMTDFINGIENNFLSVITHKICLEIWITLIKKKYSILVESILSDKDKVKFTFSPEEEAIQRIYKIVTSESITNIKGYNQSFGGKFVVEGSISNENKMINNRKPLVGFEFISLISEINDIIKHYGFNSILVICDELNHFPSEVNTEIFRNYLSVFSQKNIQFFLTMPMPFKEDKKVADDLLSAFDYRMELKHFDSSNQVSGLIKNCAENHGVLFKENCIIEIFNSVDGHPWWIQKICNKLFDDAKKNQRKEIDIDETIKSINSFEAEYKYYKIIISRGEPFRKRFLKAL